MRVAFAGSPPAAVAPLRALAGSAHEVALVITQPDRRRGRSGRPRPTAVAEAADALGLAVERPASINAAEPLERMEAAGVEALCVVAFGQILREGILGRWPCLNVHFSLLPAYRGAAPVERALMDGVTRTGVTLMQMDAGLDTGPIVADEALDVGPLEDAGALTTRLAERGGPLLVAALDALGAGRLRSRAQPEAGASLAPKIGPGDRPLDPALPAVALANRVRALSPHIGATLAIDGEQVSVWRARALEETTPAGLRVEGERLLLGCARGTLELHELQRPGRARIDAAAFLRGWRPRPA